MRHQFSPEQYEQLGADALPSIFRRTPHAVWVNRPRSRAVRVMRMVGVVAVLVGVLAAAAATSDVGRVAMQRVTPAGAAAS